MTAKSARRTKSNVGIMNRKPHAIQMIILGTIIKEINTDQVLGSNLSNASLEVVRFISRLNQTEFRQLKKEIQEHGQPLDDCKF